jgi:hypothetical protein
VRHKQSDRKGTRRNPRKADGTVETKKTENSQRPRSQEESSLVQGSWERRGSGCSAGPGAGLGKVVGGRPRGPRGGRRLGGPDARVLFTDGSLPRRGFARRGAGPEPPLTPSPPPTTSGRSLGAAIAVPTVPSAFPPPSSPSLPPAPGLAPCRHAPSLFTAAPPPPPAPGPSPPLTSRGAASPGPGTSRPRTRSPGEAPCKNSGA